MAAPLVDEVARLVSRRSRLYVGEFEDQLYRLLPDDGDERIACLGAVVDTVIATGTYPTDECHRMVEHLYTSAFSERDTFSGGNPRWIRDPEPSLVEDIIRMNHPALGDVEPGDAADTLEGDDVDDLWARDRAIDRNDGVRSVSEQNVARMHLTADAVAAGEYQLAKLVASRVTHSREDPEEILLEQLTSRAIAEEHGVKHLVHLLAITGRLRARWESVRLAKAIRDRADLLPGDSDSELSADLPWSRREWVDSLGRASITAYLADEHVTARLLANIAINQIDDLWFSGGEKALPEFVLAYTEPNPIRRLDLLNRACVLTHHGCLFPLFTRLRLDRAMLEYELTGADVRRDVETASYFYRKRHVVEGHLWNPYAIKPYTDQIPFKLAELEGFAQRVGAAPPNQRTAREVHNRYVRYPILPGSVPYSRPADGPVNLAIHRDRSRGTEMLTVTDAAIGAVAWSEDHVQVEGWTNLDGADQFVRAVYRIGEGGNGIAGSVAVFAD